MLLKVRMFNASKASATSDHFVIQLKSVNSTIEEVKQLLFNRIQSNKQQADAHSDAINKSIRIFFNGKELLPHLTVFQYGIKLNNVIQVLVKENSLAGDRTSDTQPARRGSTSSIECESEEGVRETADELSDDSDVLIDSPQHVSSSGTSNWIECDQCLDDPSIKCKNCSCCECGGKNDPSKQIICDECNSVYHLWCHKQSPLSQLPPEEEDWYCFKCVNNDATLIKEKETAYLQKITATSGAAKRRDENTDDQIASKKMKERAKPSSSNNKWGHGMACVGRRYSDLSSSFGSDFYGPIPGVEVGTTWRFRFQVSEAGLHTPLVAGIAGKEAIGASSIVFSGTYCDDIDMGDEIYYTGSGGHGVTEKTGARCSGNRPQVADQTLKRGNKALAMSCAAPFNSSMGSSAGHNWKSGKPIRVLRSGNSKNSRVRSHFSPARGIRYDGIYHVVKYWPEKSSKTGMIVWRFHLKRNDPAAAPWTKEGKNRIRRLALDKMIEPASDPLAHLSRCKDEQQQHQGTGVSNKLLTLIEKDTTNAKIWKNVLSESSLDSGLIFLRSVSESFKCACCMEVAVNQPVTSKCNHIFCRDCLRKSLNGTEGSKCPVCRCVLSRKLPGINRPLEQILRSLYPLVLTIKK